MNNTDWQIVTSQIRAIFPSIVQIVSYSRNRWMLIFAAEADNFLSTFNPLVKLTKKHKLNIPLIVSEQFIQTSLDSYPLEFLDIQSDYAIHYAVEDVVLNMKFDKDDVRLQIERELKSKWLLTRLTALQFNQKSHQLYSILQESFVSLIPVFKGFCFLSGANISKEPDKLLDSVEEILHTDVKIFRYLANQKKAPSHLLINNLFYDYIRVLNVCIEKIDTWK